MPDSFEVLVDGEDDAHVWVPTNAINNVFITPTKYVNLRGDVDIELLFSPVTQYYVVVPDVTLGDAQPTYFWFNYPSRHMMVHRKYAQRSLSELYAILFAILSTVASIFSFFLYTEGDMNPGKFIIRKEFLKAHRAQRALRNSISRGHSIGRCVDEVCAATGAIPAGPRRRRGRRGGRGVLRRPVRRAERRRRGAERRRRRGVHRGERGVKVTRALRARRARSARAPGATSRAPR